jgi:hypothetical protein
MKLIWQWSVYEKNILQPTTACISSVHLCIDGGIYEPDSVAGD